MVSRIFNSRLARFIGLFIALIGLLTTVFRWRSDVFEWLVLQPVSHVAYALLKVILPVIHLRKGLAFYDLLLPGETLRVTFGCTGIFAKR